MNFLYKKSQLQQLKAFCKVYETNSIVEVAKILNISSSSITMYIKSLENDIGILLFYRDNNRLKPTHEATLFYPQALQIVKDIDNIYINLPIKLKTKNNNKLRIACHPLVSYLLIPEILNKIYIKYPATEFFISDISYDDVINAVKHYNLDVAIFPKDIILLSKENIKYEKLWQYKATAFCHTEHPVAFIDEDKIELQDIFYRLINPNTGFVIKESEDIAKDKTKIYMNYFLIPETIISLKGITVTDKYFNKIIKEKKLNIVMKNTPDIAQNTYFCFIKPNIDITFENEIVQYFCQLIREKVETF